MAKTMAGRPIRNTMNHLEKAYAQSHPEQSNLRPDSVRPDSKGDIIAGLNTEAFYY